MHRDGLTAAVHITFDQRDISLVDDKRAAFARYSAGCGVHIGQDEFNVIADDEVHAIVIERHAEAQNALTWSGIELLAVASEVDVVPVCELLARGGRYARVELLFMHTVLEVV